jgi:hypothetical protein
VVHDKPRIRFGLIFAGVVIAGTLGMWGYLFLVADPNVPDQLDDDGLVEDIEAVCGAARDQIDELPVARDAETPQDRAQVVTEANGILREMLVGLGELVPTEGRDGRITRLWLEDWETYLGDREAYADALADGEEAELLVTPRPDDEGGGQISATIDHFANINNIEDCAIPGDV